MTDVLNIYRGATLISTVKIDQNTVLVKKIMNADKVTSSFDSDVVLPIELGDHIIVKGTKYFLNQVPTIEKNADHTYKYNLVFHSELYDLYNKLLISSDGLNDFSYTGNAIDFVTLIVEQMQLIDPAWSVGADTEEAIIKTIQFTNETCRTALTIIAKAYGFEFEVKNKTITLKEAIGTFKDITFEYGQNKGLYAITRKTVENKSLYTKVYGYGGTKNIPYDYRNHAKRLVFEERFLTKNTDIFGVKEGHYTNEDIYPKRTAPLTAVNTVIDGGAFNVNESYVEDNTLDFNINDFLAEGLTAKIVFKTGELSGYEFEIWKYDNDTQRIYFNPFTETDGYALPNDIRKPEVGDTYTLVNIKMPPSYVIQAEADLKADTQKYLDENAVPKSLYLVTIDPKYAKAQAVDLDAGDLVKIKDTYLGIDRAIRIAQISFPLTNEYKISATIADFIPYSLQEQVTRISSSNNREISNIISTINNVVRNTINNTTQIVNQTFISGGGKTIIINDHVYLWQKGFDNNVNQDKLEANDLILNGWWNRFLYVIKWRFKGGDRTKIENWEQLESIDLSNDDQKTVLRKLQLLIVDDNADPEFLLSLDADGNITKTLPGSGIGSGAGVGNVEGGSSNTVYLSTQNIDGGSATATGNGIVDGGNA